MTSLMPITSRRLLPQAATLHRYLLDECPSGSRRLQCETPVLLLPTQLPVVLRWLRRVRTAPLFYRYSPEVKRMNYFRQNFFPTLKAARRPGLRAYHRRQDLSGIISCHHPRLSDTPRVNVLPLAVCLNRDRHMYILLNRAIRRWRRELTFQMCAVQESTDLVNRTFYPQQTLPCVINAVLANDVIVILKIVILTMIQIFQITKAHLACLKIYPARLWIISVTATSDPMENLLCASVLSLEMNLVLYPLTKMKFGYLHLKLISPFH